MKKYREFNRLARQRESPFSQIYLPPMFSRACAIDHSLSRDGSREPLVIRRTPSAGPGNLFLARGTGSPPPKDSPRARLHLLCNYFLTRSSFSRANAPAAFFPPRRTSSAPGVEQSRENTSRCRGIFTGGDGIRFSWRLDRLSRRIMAFSAWLSCRLLHSNYYQRHPYRLVLATFNWIV